MENADTSYALMFFIAAGRPVIDPGDRALIAPIIGWFRLSGELLYLLGGRPSVHLGAVHHLYTSFHDLRENVHACSA